MSKKSDLCEICGKNLKLITDLDELVEATCSFCHKRRKTEIICPDGHYICDECHSKDAIGVIRDFCLETDLTNPYEIADEIMKHPNFKMYGPEHHVLVPATLLTCLKNLGVKNADGDPVTDDQILLAIQRSSKIPGGWCGFYGTCGAGAGSGVALSCFMRATPSTDRPRTIANITTARSLTKIADDLEHCCKRSVKHALGEALKVINENFGSDLQFQPVKCVFSSRNDKCEKEKCPFHD